MIDGINVLMNLKIIMDFLDTDGCFDVIGAESTIVPITDSDNDGYIDEFDSCVFEPETWNKYNDLDGCPDSLP